MRIADLRIFVSEKINKEKPTQVLDTISDIDEMFYTLSKDKKIWSYYNYYLLKAIIEEFASEDQELNTGMTNYLNNLAGFHTSTALSAYLETRGHLELEDGQNFALTDELFCQLRVKLEVNVNEKSMKYVEDLWASLCKVFALPPCSLLLGEMAKSSLQIAFYFPISQKDKISHQIHDNDAFFKEHNIVEVRINGTLIYSSEETLQDVKVSCFVYFVCMSTATTSPNLPLSAYKGEAEQGQKQRLRPKKRQQKYQGRQKKHSKRRHKQQQWHQTKQYSQHTQEQAKEKPGRWQRVLHQVRQLYGYYFHHLFPCSTPSISLSHFFDPLLQVSLMRIMGVLLLFFLIYYIGSSLPATPTIQSVQWVKYRMYSTQVYNFKASQPFSKCRGI